MEFSIRNAIKTMPKSVVYKIEKQLSYFKGGISELCEVRLIRGDGSTIFVRNKGYKLYVRVDSQQLRDTLLRLCHGSLYAHRDTIARGYISFENGIRVGVCGEARYEKEKLICIDDISTLVYRFPNGESSLTEELYNAYLSCERGMLIYSVAGGGKTTALRSLCKTIAKRHKDIKIAVVDERGEFFLDECENLGIALLRGYKRTLGMDIALRTLSAGLIAVDEIGGADESYSVRQSLLSGVKFIATAHAATLDELLNRDSIKPYLDKEIFDLFLGIFNTDGNYFCKVEKIKC